MSKTLSKKYFPKLKVLDLMNSMSMNAEYILI